MDGNDSVIERLCDARQKAISARLDGMDRAIALHKDDMERRLRMLNELRAEVVQDREQLIGKQVYEGRMESNDNRHLLLYNRVTAIETRTAVWTAVIGLFFVGLQIVLHFLK